eukprot:TRINITY_DN2625_c0_g1_i11.p1 TRINITY_DN2625_c0_g1~~TRINITY_DN2625_c0_g1_i11.p1  ORF type:complete len:405 (-),score=165.33 TRINITY_DN2625_c0_g1_i11:1419-2633(-)
MGQLTRGSVNPDSQILIECWDQAHNDVIGTAMVTIGELFSQKKEFEMNDHLKKTKRNYRNSGILIFEVEAVSAKSKEKPAINNVDVSKLQPNDIIKIVMHGRQIAKVDTLSESDPYFTVTRVDAANDVKTVIYTSEKIDNNPNPEWKSFNLNVSDVTGGNNNSWIVVEVWDENSLAKDVVIGSFTTNLGKLFSLGEYELVNLEEKKKKNYLNSGIVKIVSVDVIKETKRLQKDEVNALIKTLDMNDTLKIVLQGKNLEKLDLTSGSDPFLVISRLGTSGASMQVYRSEVVNNQSNPNWKPIEISVSALTGGSVNFDTSGLIFECLDHNSVLQSSLIGRSKISFSRFLEVNEIILTNEKKTSKKDYVNSGQIRIIDIWSKQSQRNLPGLFPELSPNLLHPICCNL